MALPPSLVITPPEVAELIVMFVASVVVKVGITGSFLQLSKRTVPEIKLAIRIKPISLFILFYLKFNVRYMKK
jgi:hypothetical protein